MDDWHLVATLGVASPLIADRVTAILEYWQGDFVCVRFDRVPTPPTRLFLFARNLVTVLPMNLVRFVLSDVAKLDGVDVCETFGMTLQLNVFSMELPMAVHLGCTDGRGEPWLTNKPIATTFLLDHSLEHYMRLFQGRVPPTIMEDADEVEGILNTVEDPKPASSPLIYLNDRVAGFEHVWSPFKPPRLLPGIDLQARTSAADTICKEEEMADILRRTFLDDLRDRLSIKPRPTLDMAGTPSCMRCGIARAVVFVHHVNQKLDDCVTLCANCQTLFAIEIGTERCPQCGEFATDHENIET